MRRRKPAWRRGKRSRRRAGEARPHSAEEPPCPAAPSQPRSRPHIQLPVSRPPFFFTSPVFFPPSPPATAGSVLSTPSLAVRLPATLPAALPAARARAHRPLATTTPALLRGLVPRHPPGPAPRPAPPRISSPPQCRHPSASGTAHSSPHPCPFPTHPAFPRRRLQRRPERPIRPATCCWR